MYREDVTIQEGGGEDRTIVNVTINAFRTSGAPESIEETRRYMMMGYLRPTHLAQPLVRLSSHPPPLVVLRQRYKQHQQFLNDVLNSLAVPPTRLGLQPGLEFVDVGQQSKGQVDVGGAL